MKNNYTITKTKKTVTLRSKKYRIDVTSIGGHLYVRARGPYFKRRGLTSVKSDLSMFELKVSSLYFYKLAREYGKSMNIRHVNYAEIFGSCFD